MQGRRPCPAVLPCVPVFPRVLFNCWTEEFSKEFCFPFLLLFKQKTPQTTVTKKPNPERWTDVRGFPGLGDGEIFLYPYIVLQEGFENKHRAKRKSPAKSCLAKVRCRLLSCRRAHVALVCRVTRTDVCREMRAQAARFSPPPACAGH